MKRLIGILLSIALSMLYSLAQAAVVDGPDRGLKITTVSTRPDSIAGGNVLVRIDRLRFPNAGVQVLLNNNDVSGAFKVQADGSLLGLLTGLNVGQNQLIASTIGPNGPTFGDKLTLTDYSIKGPVFSGPHESPFECMTDQFPIPGTTNQFLGAPLDSDCSAATRVDYVYKNTANAFVPLPSGTGYPADLVQTTTTDGKTVNYIVRVETGTINRAIYQTAVLHDPQKDPAPSPFTPPPSWNQKLVYTLGGGCVGGYYIQGKSIGNSGILEDLMLRQGYGVASSTLNVFGNNCQEVLAAESLMMVRQHFIENFGPVKFTIGYGCSGGSEQAQPISDDYPGMLDGIIVGCSFPELTAGITLDITDADLFWHYLQAPGVSWTATDEEAATGYPTATTIQTIGPGNAVRTKAQGGSCNSLIPVDQRFDQVTNPQGVRCDIYDHLVNVFGRDPVTGYARRPLDNVGVQYGLGALNAGTITVAQFLDLNQKIGGYDNNGNYVSTRTLGDVTAIQIAYRTGRINYTGRGLRRTPIIDYRGYVDQPENGNEVHARFHSFSVRERLTQANGNYNNQVMLVEDGVSAGTTGLFGDTSPVLSHALTQMDEWITALQADTSKGPILTKIQNAKPADLVDACYTNNGTVKIAETQVYSGNTTCNQLYPAFSTPRMVAGEPLANNVLKCQLKQITPSDYTVSFTPSQMGQLKAIFPQGVCDYTLPGVGQEPTQSVWDFF